ncbi:glutaredoxin family protein [Candidatus Uhrbacteria bacterium]|nr:glutaredoxin family protein [Candidatus Uhrbacteria bacterium]
MHIIIYTKSGCPWCTDALAFLQKNHIEFEEREVRANSTYFDELIQKSGQEKTPTFDIDGEILADSDVDQIKDYLLKRGVLHDV